MCRSSSVTDLQKEDASPTSKKSESFSVSALLKPDIPKKNTKNSTPCYQETISVTRSLIIPPLVDLMKETPKNSQDYSSAFLQRSLLPPAFFPPSIYQAKEGEERSFLPTPSWWGAMAAAFATSNQAGAQYPPTPSAEDIYRLRHQLMSSQSAMHPHHHHLLMRPGMMPIGKSDCCVT